MTPVCMKQEYKSLENLGYVLQLRSCILFTKKKRQTFYYTLQRSFFRPVRMFFYEKIRISQCFLSFFINRLIQNSHTFKKLEDTIITSNVDINIDENINKMTNKLQKSILIVPVWENLLICLLLCLFKESLLLWRILYYREVL